MFVYKTSEELEKLTTSELDQYKADLKAHEAELLKTAISEAVKKELATAKTELEEFLGKEITNQIVDIKSKDRNDENKSFYQQLLEVMKANKEALIALKDNPQGSVKLEINKVVADMTIPTHTTGIVWRTERDSEIYNAPRKPRFISQILNITPTNARTITWLDKVGIEGAPAMVPEGGLKPQKDWNLVEATAQAKKVAVIVTVSKEMLDDIEGMARDVMDEIEYEILDFMEKQWINGDGTGNNISGILDNAVPFAAGAFAGKIDQANYKDVLRVAINQVRMNGFEPNYILMSTSDGTAMDVEKASDGHYVYPTYQQGNNVDGIPIIESNYLTAGQFVVGDFTKYKAKMREGLTLDTGYKTGDWEKNFVSFLGEARFFGYISQHNYGAIVFGTFATAKTALETP
jgi:HK97 family phage major capsid protein